MPTGVPAGPGAPKPGGEQCKKGVQEPLWYGIGTRGITASDDGYYSQLDMEVVDMNQRAWRHPWRWEEYPAIYGALTRAAMRLREVGLAHHWVPITIGEHSGQTQFLGGDLLVRGCCAMGVGDDFGTAFLGQYKSGILVDVMREWRATLPPQSPPPLLVFDRPKSAQRCDLAD